MRIIKLGETDIKIMGTAVTAFHYKKAFGQKLSGDMLACEELEHDNSAFDDVNFLQMVWAMARTCDKNIKPFENWLEDLGPINLGDVIDDIMEEAMNATFREPQTTK